MVWNEDLRELFGRSPDVAVVDSAEPTIMYAGWRDLRRNDGTGKYIIARHLNYNKPELGYELQFAEGNYIAPRYDWDKRETYQYKKAGD